ncbi:MAG: helix-turn-helix domain-containing protein [Janthinobacterium lividum]
MSDTQDVDLDYDEFLQLLAQRVKNLRQERNLSLRDMVVDHGYHDSNYRRIERDGVGGIQSLMRLCKAFQISLAELLNGLGDYNKTDLQNIAKRVADEAAEISKSKGQNESH